MTKPLVVILAGGTGSHFVPFVQDKTLFPFMGKPLLQHTIEMVEQNGFSQALIVTNARNEAWLSTYQPFNITLETHLQKQPGGMGQALSEIRTQIGNRPFLLINAVDVINPVFFKQLFRECLEERSFITGKHVTTDVPAGYIRATDGRATSIVEKPADGARPSDLVNLVFHFISNPDLFFRTLEQTSSRGDDWYEQTLNTYMTMQEVRVLTYHDLWSKLKFPHHVLNVMETILAYRLVNHQSRSAYISPLADLEGTVYVDDGAHIDAYAVVKGPSYIGRGAKIGNHTLVRQSIVEEEAIVGFGSEVARSYIGPRTLLHHNFIGDSVLESDINPGYGTTTANLRLDTKPIRMKLPDGSYVQTDKVKLGALIAQGVSMGIFCSIMPGMAIERHAQILPNARVG